MNPSDITDTLTLYIKPGGSAYLPRNPVTGLTVVIKEDRRVGEKDRRKVRQNIEYINKVDFKRDGELRPCGRRETDTTPYMDLPTPEQQDEVHVSITETEIDRLIAAIKTNTGLKMEPSVASHCLSYAMYPRFSAKGTGPLPGSERVHQRHDEPRSVSNPFTHRRKTDK